MAKELLALNDILQGYDGGTLSINVNSHALCKSMIACCNICGCEGNFVLKDLKREGHICANCSASSRHRAVIYALGLCVGYGDLPLVSWPKNKMIRILEASGRSSYPMILREKFEYYNTEYNPKPKVTQKPFTRFTDLQNLVYPDEEFDYVIASDVLEHVRDDEKAFHEVFRVLKTNGVFIMTVPYEHNRAETITRVRREGDNDVFVLPPEYHGGGGQTLAYRSYGRDLLNRLQHYGFSVGYLELEVPKYEIDRQAVFIGVKGNYIDLSKFHIHEVDKGSQRVTRASPLLLLRLFVIIKYNLFSVRHFISEVVRKLTDTFRKSKKGS